MPFKNKGLAELSASLDSISVLYPLSTVSNPCSLSPVH